MKKPLRKLSLALHYLVTVSIVTQPLVINAHKKPLSNTILYEQLEIPTNFKNFIEAIIAKAIVNNQTQSLPSGLLRCYEDILQGKTTLRTSDLIEAYPELIREFQSQIDALKAPRPDAPGNSNGAPVGSLFDCNFDEVLSFLNRISQIVTQCCIILQQDFAFTWTILADIRNTLTSSCSSNISCTSEFNGTYTAIADLENTLTLCCSAIQNNFEGTFTTLTEINNTLTSCCSSISSFTSEFNGTYTALADLENTLTQCCSALETNFEGTFSTLTDISDSLSTCCAEILSNFTTFNSTLTVFVDTTATFSSLVTILIETTSVLVSTVTTLESLTSSITSLLTDIDATLTACCTNMTNNFNGTFTSLTSLNNTLTSCCTNITNEFNATFTALADIKLTITTDFNGTFTVLNQILINDTIGTFTAINGILNTLTACCNNITNEFNGTFTSLSSLNTTLTSCCTNITNEFNSSFTALADIKLTITTDFNGTFTVLNQILINDTIGTFTAINGILNTLTACCNNITNEFNGTFTSLSSLNTTLTSCCTAIANNFNGTFTSLVDIKNTFTTDFDGTFTTLNALSNSGCTNIPITQADVDAAGGNYIISSSGNYFLKENISSSGVAFGSIFTIDANDVTFDLCNRQITGAPGNLTSGIFVNTSTNVIVKNGAIENMLVAGLVLNGGSTAIEFDSITTISCMLYGFQIGNNGFVATQADNLDPISDLRIIHCAAIACSGLFYTPPLLFEFKEFTRLSRFTLSNVGGLFAFNCSNVVIQDSLFNQNLGKDVFGVGLFECSNFKILNCLMNDNHANQLSSGLSLNLSNNNYIENCQFNFNLGNSITRFSVGLGGGAVLVSSNNNVFNSCQASSNAGDTAAGFVSSDGFNNVFKECVSTNNTTTVGEAFGFVLENETGSQIIECQSSGNIGFLSGAGFSCLTGTGNVCESCIATDNHGELTAAGFIMFAENGSSIKYCTSNSNTSTTTAWGILLNDPITSCTLCYVQNNSIANNRGGFSSFGILDAATNASTSFVAGNFAFNNGTNFDVTYPGAILPVVSGSFSTGLPATGTTGSFDNISINP